MTDFDWNSVEPTLMDKQRYINVRLKEDGDIEIRQEGWERGDRDQIITVHPSNADVLIAALQAIVDREA